MGVGLYPRHFVPRPASCIYTPPLIRKSPFYRDYSVVIYTFYFYILRPFYKWSRNIIIEILILLIEEVSLYGLNIPFYIGSYYRVSLLHLLLGLNVTSIVEAGLYPRHFVPRPASCIYTLPLIGKSHFYRVYSHYINGFLFLLLRPFVKYVNIFY